MICYKRIFLSQFLNYKLSIFFNSFANHWFSVSNFWRQSSIGELNLTQKGPAHCSITCTKENLVTQHAHCQKNKFSFLICKGPKGVGRRHMSHPIQTNGSWKQRAIIKFSKSSIIPYNEFCCISNFGLLFKKGSFPWWNTFG
jgi:hypothetical protein